MQSMLEYSQSGAVATRPLLTVVAAMVLALIGAWLTNFGALTVGFSLYVVSGILVLGYLRWRDKTLNLAFTLISAAVALFCLFLSLRAALVLHLLNLLCLLILACIAYQLRTDKAFPVSGVIAWLASPFKLIGRSLASPLISITQVQQLDVSGVSKDALRHIAVGLLLTLPVVFVFGGLLTSSDQRYSNFVHGLFTFDLKFIADHLIEWSICWVASSALLCLSQSSPNNSDVRQLRFAPNINGIQALVVMSGLAVLFLSYVLVQLTYFFGSDALVISTDGLTYADYAKQGFWELVWVALGSIGLIYGVHFSVRNQPQGLRAWVYRLSLLLTGLNAVLLASACHRMSLYILAYDLSQLRFYGSVFLLYVFTVLSLMTLRLATRKLNCLPWDGIRAFLSFVALVNLINPSLLIARYNLEGQFLIAQADSMYFMLGKDAVPELARRSVQTPAQACEVKQRLAYVVGEEPNWRNWTWSDAKARSALQQWQVEDCQVQYKRRHRSRR